jgi:selenocysteine lyase/cysteine desulfurase
VNGPADALAFLRENLPAPDSPRRLIVSGGDPPELLAAVDAGFRRPGDEFVLTPPTVDGAPAPDAVAAAMARGRLRRSVMIFGEVTPTGAVAPLLEIDELRQRAEAEVVLDLTLARWIGPPARAHCDAAGFLAALDRWDEAPRGAWGVCLRGVERSPGAVPPPHLLQLDAALRRRLTETPQVTLWPLGASRRAPGVVSFSLAGWAADEAAAVLAEAFGVQVEAGPLTAAPLPAPPRAGSGFLRASLAAASTPAEVETFLSAVSWLAARGGAGRSSH